MEFFKEIPNPDLDVTHLKALLRIKNLTRLCASINTVLSEKGDDGTIYCLWGQFDVRRLELRYGVRFSLLNCPHALAWTITLDESKQHIILHCTTDKKHHEEDFVESIHDFMTDLSHGLATALQ
jgi:hypothetical protein